MNYADVFASPRDSILQVLIDLQNHALDKLTAKTQFQRSGLATLKIKTVGKNVPVKNIVLSLDETGSSLKSKIVTDILKAQHGLSLKLICNGHVLNDGQILKDQQISNNSKILVLMLANDGESQKVVD